MITDTEIRKSVEEQLRSDPDIEAANISVAVENGVAELSGFVFCYRQKLRAQMDAEQATGVVKVANDIDVHLPVVDWRPDSEIARDVVAVLQKELPYSHEGITVAVENGWVTLDSKLEWDYQCARVANAVIWIRGITGVRNLITLKPKLEPTDIAQTFQEKQQRARPDAHLSRAETGGDEPILEGTVRAWAQRETTGHGA